LTDPPLPSLQANLAALRPARTRFAPAPTGLLHLGHAANALWVWGAARLAGARVLLRIEDHDRQRSSEDSVRAILEDLDWLGFVADEGPVRQTTADAVEGYEAALGSLADAGLVYRCACSRSTFAAWARDHGRDWSGPGCPEACRTRTRPGDDATNVRVVLGGGEEVVDDLLQGRRVGVVSEGGDLVARDRSGNWSYAFAVVVDDLRQGVDLIVRGDDLLAATPDQISLGRLLGREAPAHVLHHPLIRRPGGAKVSKSNGDTGIRDLRARGASPADVLAEAARLGSVPAEIVGAATAG
jgi:glutamyl/glutaminyl-tRNA synthetase